MRLRYQIPLFALALVAAAACDDSRRITGRVDLEISGALEKTIHGTARTGYGSSISGAGYSFAVSWPEDSIGQHDGPMSARNASPLFTWYSGSQPPEGLHPVSAVDGGPPGALHALIEGPHNNTLWSSDSGIVRIVKSDDRSLALVGTFDIWLSCTQDCPCKDSPCQARVRGSMAAP